MITVMLVIVSCLYVPTPEHGDSQIPDEIMNFLVPGETTRADVLLQFGDPAQRFEEDRYFIYYWQSVIGYTIFVLPHGGNVAPDENLHYLCLEFTPDNVLYRWKHFEEGYGGSHPEKQVLEWMKEDFQQ